MSKNDFKNFNPYIAGFLIASLILLVIAVIPNRNVESRIIYPPAALLQPGDITSSMIRDGQILNEDVSSTAAIAWSKINATGLIVNADVSSTAAIAWSKINATGLIVNADVSSTAAIADSKLAAITTAGKVDGSAITNLANIPSGAGNIPTANLGNVGMTKIGESTLTSASTTLEVSFSARKNLLVYFSHGTSSGATAIKARFNDSTAALFAIRSSGNGGADTTAANQDQLYYFNNADETSPVTAIIEISNPSNNLDRLIISHSIIDNGSNTAPDRVETIATWATSTQISKIIFSSFSAVTMPANSYVTVYGSSD